MGHSEERQGALLNCAAGFGPAVHRQGIGVIGTHLGAEVMQGAHCSAPLQTH